MKVCEFREILIEDHNLGHDWEFNEKQSQTLVSYYIANQILMNCLNNCPFVSNDIRKEFQEVLLLPIAEIEKRKREKVE